MAIPPPFEKPTTEICSFMSHMPFMDLTYFRLILERQDWHTQFR
jgi:hypothetical protein